ncbi:MAG: cytochrome b/b6 domain-containing protein [Roseitalea sp.]|jgi:cytochrome b561|nr:cytochrome b/b6 domain-containing protein [Roseitalea sp.]MBO6722789.1 cytochrome b/b6 domain-containing protein [Roseitalea sp.]MBO6744017.1 cytochrome b/b6 domain-containing protein [Roseitalea sp.]
MSATTQPKRYHPLLVTLHWLLALMIGVALFAGGVLLAETPNSDPDKIFMLRAHMSIGILILLLMLVRLVVRARTEKPPHVETGNGLLDRAGVWMHWTLYAVVILMAGSGIGISVLAGLPPIVFGGSGDPLPADFWAYPPRYAHAILANILMALIVLHIAAFAWHQWIRKDSLFRRMWFGDRH